MIKEHQLDCLIWECTVRSNLVCRSCNVACDQEDEHAHTDMPLWNFFHLIDLLPHDFIHRPDGSSMQVMIAGGEPLLRTDLEECGRELSKRRIPWGLTTNALEMSQTQLESLIRSGMQFIKVEVNTAKLTELSLKSSEGSYKNTLNTLAYIANEKYIELEATTAITAENLSHLSEIKEMLINQGVKNWRLFNKLDVLSVDCDRASVISENQIEELFDFVNKVRSENQINIVFACDNLVGSYEKKIHEEFFFCKAGISMATVFADGFIGVCLLNRDDNCILGNIYNDDFYEVWNSGCANFLTNEWTKYRCELHCGFNRYCKGKLQDNFNLENTFENRNHSLTKHPELLKYAL